MYPSHGQHITWGDTRDNRQVQPRSQGFLQRRCDCQSSKSGIQYETVFHEQASTSVVCWELRPDLGQLLRRCKIQKKLISSTCFILLAARDEDSSERTVLDWVDVRVRCSSSGPLRYLTYTSVIFFFASLFFLHSFFR